MNDTPVSVIIPVQAAPEQVSSCIRAVRDQDYKPVDLIVVADSQKYGELPDDCRFVETEAPTGIADALNAGIAAAKGEIVVLLMPHCQPANKKWLTELVRPFGDEEVVATSSELHLADIEKHNLSSRLNRAEVAPRPAANAEPTEVQLLSHKSDALRKEFLKKEKRAYNPYFIPPGEYVDLSLRSKSAGKKILLCPTSRVEYKNPPFARSLSGVYKHAFQLGEADAMLDRVWSVDWLGSRVFAAALLSFLLLPVAAFSLPVAVVLAGLLFAWGWFLPFHIPLVKWEWPLALFNLAIYTTIVLSIHNHWAPAIFPPRESHPAIIRQWCIVIAMCGSYFLLSLGAGFRTAVRATVGLSGILLVPLLTILAALWHCVKGAGFIVGFFSAGKAQNRED
ncbi:MAG: glycosyltransferase [Candidatus Brocadiia bacterium]